MARVLIGIVMTLMFLGVVNGQGDEHTQGSILENWGGTLQQKTYNGDYRNLNILSHEAIPMPLARQLQYQGFVGAERVRYPSFPTYTYPQYNFYRPGRK
ncbi:unnamed protein product [Bursaphelenchus xylophilus]|uniref:(pine wood nematode) hypothetical protein n=1 Tax=Bursaphelenchus xylophilus TaxID=6326 RepID=A0A1I7SLV6_BURXY|nr:unnamed protein product [Bursaphelenchus xylophilus]CAG9129870.1 unnamed protein product [Bursaphelenchus xylophilus]